MPLERLDADVILPFDDDTLKSGTPIERADYFRSLVKTLQDLLEKITIVANYGLDLYDGEAIYSKLKNPDGSYPIGTWRLIQVGDVWQRQVQLVLGTWTPAGDFNIPV